MLDSILNSISSFIESVSDWLTLPSVPWGEFDEKWNYLVDLIAPWNQIFPITDLITILGLVVAFFISLMIFYTVVLVKSFIPFSGGK